MARKPARKQRDWFCQECGRRIGSSVAWGFGSKPNTFRCAEHPWAQRIMGMEREPYSKPHATYRESMAQEDDDEIDY